VIVRLLGILFVVAGGAFVAGVLYAGLGDSPHNDENFSVVWQSWDILDKAYYYDLPPEEELAYGAAQGLLAAAGDPYTFFAPPARAELDRQATAGEFGGIGAQVMQADDGRFVIAELYPDLPAQQAGIRRGDVIVAVDGTELDDLTLPETVALLRGEIGSAVRVTLYRTSEAREFSVKVERARVELPTVYAELIDSVAHVRLYRFNANATTLVAQAIEQALADGAQAMILDLRGNPGGLLDQAVGVSDLFLDGGRVVTERSQDEETGYDAVSGQLAEDVPLVVLIDEGSASAAEVVAGALHDHGRAVLIGRPSYGKGSVQHVYDLPDDSQVHVTVAIWLTPGGTPLQGQGLMPDVLVEVPTGSVPEQDPFIEAALDYLAEAVPPTVG
jgi:carboxyl-terminal processing protease